MEITELISFYLNENSKILEVTFRIASDAEEELREDKIDFSEIEDFGYNFAKTENDFPSILDEDYEDDDYLDSSIDFIDNQEIISFLNEYYSIYSERLPDSEPF